MCVLFRLCGEGDHASFRMPIDKASIKIANVPYVNVGPKVQYDAEASNGPIARPS